MAPRRRTTKSTRRVVAPSDRVTRSRAIPSQVSTVPPPVTGEAISAAAPRVEPLPPPPLQTTEAGQEERPVTDDVPSRRPPPPTAHTIASPSPPLVPTQLPQPEPGSLLAAIPPAPATPSADPEANARALNALLMAEREQHERDMAAQRHELETLRAQLRPPPTTLPAAQATLPTPVDIDAIVAAAVRATTAAISTSTNVPPAYQQAPPSAPLIPGVPVDVVAAARAAIVDPMHPAYGMTLDKLLDKRSTKPTGEKPRITLSLDSAEDVTTAVASFRPWELQLQSKFLTDFAIFLTDREKVEYAMRFISGKLLTALEGWFCDPSTTEITYAAFLNEIKTSIGFNNQRASARRALEKLTQGSDDVTTYFNNLRFHWNLGDIPLHDRVRKFVASLRRDISIALDSVDFGDDLYRALEAARRVENAQLQRNLELSRTSIQSSSNSSFTSRKFGPKFRGSDFKSMDKTFASSKPPVPHTPTLTPFPDTSMPKDISAKPTKFDIPSEADLKFNERFPRCAKKPEGWQGPWWDPEINPRKLSESDQRLLYSQRRCWRCRGSGHRVGDPCCPHEDGTSAARRSTKPAQLASITANDPTAQGVTTTINSDGEVCNDVCSPPPSLSYISLSTLSTSVPLTKTVLTRGRHLVLKGQIHSEGHNYTIRCLVDNGSEATLMSGEVAGQLHLPLYSLSRNIPLVNASKQLHSVISKATVFSFTLGEGHNIHNEYLVAYVAPVPTYTIILGDPWLRSHDPAISFTQRTLTFAAQCRTLGCIKETLKCTIKAEDFDGPPLRKEIAVYDNQVQQDSTTLPISPTRPTATDDSDIQYVSASTFLRAAAHPRNTAYMILPDGSQVMVCTIVVNANFSDADLDTHLTGPPQYSQAEIVQRLPTQLRDFADVFSREAADTLPPHRPGVDHEIHLIPNAKPPQTRNYRPHSKREQEAITKQIRELHSKGYIRPSNSSICSPLLCVSKPGGGIRVCTDLRAVNDITIKTRFPIPLLQDILNLLILALWFTKFDIIHAFNMIRMAPGFEHLTSFICRLGQFEWLVMPFGACNAPATFQSFINSIFFDILDKYVTAYLDDILVFSSNWEDHIKHVREVLTRLRRAQLNLDIDKSEFFVHEVKYLGVIISQNGVSMDPSKIQAIQEWKQPSSVLDVQSFLGFVNHYR